jgi:hypothetical protein
MADSGALSVAACGRCGREARGRSYRFYYGRLVASSTSQANLLVARTSSTTATYQVDGSSGLFLCSGCVRRSKRFRDLSLTVLGLLFGLILIATAFGKSWWNPGSSTSRRASSWPWPGSEA